MGQHLIKTLHIVVAQSQFSFIPCQFLLISQTHNDLFAVHSRNGGNTDIVFHMVYVHRGTAVLRFSLLRYVHAGNNLQPGNNCRVNRHIIAHGLHQISVDTEPDPDSIPHRLKVDVAGSLAHGLLDDGTYHHDNRGRLRQGDFASCGVTRRLISSLFFFILIRNRDHRLASKIPVDLKGNLAACAENRDNLEIRDNGNVIYCHKIHRIRHGYPHHIGIVFVKTNGDQAVFFCNRLVYRIDGGFVQLHIAQLHILDMKLITQYLHNRPLRDIAKADQRLSKLCPPLPLFLQRTHQLLFRNKAFLNQ